MLLTERPFERVDCALTSRDACAALLGAEESDNLLCFWLGCGEACSDAWSAAWGSLPVELASNVSLHRSSPPNCTSRKPMLLFTASPGISTALDGI